MTVREFFANHEWIQGFLFKYNKNNDCIIGGCLKGAIYYCCEYDMSKTNSIMDKIEKHLEVENSVCWNDSPGRTLDEVLQVCDEIGI